MSKQYKGKTCIYCAKPGASFTGDHIVARSFFSVNERENLPQVPTCASCNSTKSTLETYLTALLPQAARHQGDVSDYWANSRRRIEKNQKLHRELRAGVSTSSRVDAMGRPITETVMPFDSSKLLELSKYIAKGLLFHHWQVVVPKDQIVHSQFMNDAGESNFSNTIDRLQMIAADFPSIDVIRTTGLIQLGGQAVTYEGFFSPLDEPLSMWRLNFYQAIFGIPGVNETTSNLMMHIPSKGRGAMATQVEEDCPICRQAAVFERIGSARKHFQCEHCGEFVVASLAERWLRSSLNDGRMDALREKISEVAEDQLLVIERDPIGGSTSSTTYSASIMARSEALRG
ncbi:HNH endonuclease [Hylemonella sp. W303a]|uniref:HNH endonuclease n=1 Tax=Hylemonella sp. W303a TaxID=3389873 RepID=UPI00396AF28C